MKKFKTFVTMLAAVTAMILLPGIFTLKASAAEPATYYIDYTPDNGWYVLTEEDDGGWYLLTEDGRKDIDNAPAKSMQYFYSKVKCGDVVVVTCYYENSPQLDLGKTRLGNVTLFANNSAFVMIKSAGIAEFHAMSDSISAISAPIINAYVYDPAVVNFNCNVKDINLIVEEGTQNSSVMGAIGTVESLKVLYKENNNSYTLYGFPKGTFGFDGSVTSNVFNSVPPVSPFNLSINSQTAIPKLKDVFDEHYYADTYADLKAAFGYNREALWAHYITCGIAEGRSMNSLLNVTNYRYQNYDLNAAFGDNWDAYLAHYLTLGAKEGRNSGTDFQAMEYANWYEDLKKAYGNDVLALWQHYKAIGVEWSRQP